MWICDVHDRQTSCWLAETASPELLKAIVTLLACHLAVLSKSKHKKKAKKSKKLSQNFLL
jgi:hypothetical protein